jgi:5-aminopentanamidase
LKTPSSALQPKAAQIVVRPELEQSGYAFRDQKEALQVAEPQNGATLAHSARLAQEIKLIIVGGFCEKLSDTQVTNSAALLDAQGLCAVCPLAERQQDILT